VIALRERGDEVAHRITNEDLYYPDRCAKRENDGKPNARRPLAATGKERLGEEKELLEEAKARFSTGGHPPALEPVFFGVDKQIDI
jgi:hypothetical protein